MPPLIVSHTHRFIYVRTRKTGSTSLEMALRSVCGPDDVVTAARGHKHSDGAGAADLPGQNVRVPLRGLTPGFLRSGFRRRTWPEVFDHISARRVRQIVGPETWAGYHVFTVERNPWDRCVSSYFYYRPGLPEETTFSAFLRSAHQARLTNYPLYTDRHGRLMVDEVLRFERLEEDVEQLWRRLGLPGLTALTQSNKSRGRPDYREMYSPKDIEMVAERCRPEIELFGYAFD